MSTGTATWTCLRFDRDGGRILVFEKTSDGGWNERPDWSQGWPALKHWVLLRDFDCDGMPDLFTGYQNSIHVYRNTSAGPGVPTFEPYALPLTASWDFGTGAQELPLVCLTIDKPAIFDVDNDGDLDFICFTETSSSLYRFFWTNGMRVGFGLYEPLLWNGL